MDLLDNFKEYFDTASLTDGFVVYTDTMDDRGDSAIGIYEYKGAGSLPQINTPTRSIQIVARAKTVKVARTKIQALYNALVTETGQINLTDERWAVLYLRQTPFKFKVDDEGRTYYAFNIGCTTYYK